MSLTSQRKAAMDKQPRSLTDLINIGPSLAERLKACGVADAETFLRLGDAEAFTHLAAHFPERACVQTRLAFAGAARGVRWKDLDEELKAEIFENFSSPAR